MARFPLHPVHATSLLTALLGAGCGDSTTPNVVVGPDSLKLALQFSTYLGGTGEEVVRDVAFDAQGNLYITGGTRSPEFPVSAGALDRTFDASGTYLSDAFITKVSPTGQIIWSTFLGGPDHDRAYGIEVDESGFVYVAGRAGIGFPVTPGALQTTFAGSTFPEGAGPTDGFICKLRPDGTQVVFCTYLGNKDYVLNRDIAIDANHDIYLATSNAAVDSFPSSWFANAYQKTRRGGRDGLIIKIKGDGSGVLWATYLGGSGEESNGNTLRVDASGVYVAIGTSSTDMPTPNGFDHTLGGGGDLYVAKLSLDGSQLLYGTYVGGSGQEAPETHHLAVDRQGNAYIAIGSTSSDAPTTAGSFQPASAGQTDVLVVKIGPAGTLLAGTYVGGSDNESAEGIALDPSGNVYFTGGSRSTNLPVTGGPPASGISDLVAVTLSPDLSRLLFSHRLGGSGDDYGRGAAVSASAFAVGGQTTSSNWPVTAAFQPGAGGGPGDGMVAMFLKQP